MKKTFIIALLNIFIVICFGGEKFIIDGVRYEIISAEDKTVELDSIIDYDTENYTTFKVRETVDYNGTDYCVVRIGVFAFKDSKFKRVEASHKVTEIGDGAFAFSDLQEISGIEKVKIIHEGVFLNSKLKAFTFPDSLEKVGLWIFKNCDDLRSIEIPKTSRNTRTKIPHYVVEVIYHNPIPSRENLLIHLEDGVEGGTLGSRMSWIIVPEESLKAYQDMCSYDEDKSMIIPSNYALNDSRLFKYGELYFRKIPNTDNEVEVTRPPYEFMAKPYGYGIGGKISIPERVTLDGKEYIVTGIGGFIDSEYTEVYLPETIKGTAKNSFYKSKVQKMDISHLTGFIGIDSFTYSDIREAKIPENIAFSNTIFVSCHNLEKLELPIKCNHIWGPCLSFFEDCPSLKTLICNSPEPYNLCDVNYIFEDNNTDYQGLTLLVPKGSLEAYQKAFGGYVSEIREMETSDIGRVDEFESGNQAVNMVLGKGILEISGAEGRKPEITDLKGNVVFSQTLNDAYITLSLSTGIYIVRIDEHIYKIEINN